MVNSEQENYTGEPQEENWLAKNKTTALGIGLVVLLACFWLFSNSNKGSTAPAATSESSSVAGYWDKFTHLLSSTPTMGTVIGIIIGCEAIKVFFRSTELGQKCVAKAKSILGKNK